MYHVTFFLIPQFSMMALSSAIEPLRSANRSLGKRFYKWTVAAKEVGPVMAGNGLEINAVNGIGDPQPTDLTIVVASLGVENYRDGAVLAHLHKLRAQGHQLGALSNGTLILARAGAILGRRVTIHWELQTYLAEEFPDTNLCSDLYCVDRGLLTAAGGTAAMDLMLELIAEKNDRETAADVAEQFLHGPIRQPQQRQRSDVRSRYHVSDQRVQRAIEAMESEISSPLRVSRIAAVAGISERQLERLFRRDLNQSPNEFYMMVRVRAAHEMLLHSTLSFEEIARRTGFSSGAHFSRTISDRFGATPTEVRGRESKD